MASCGSQISDVTRGRGNKVETVSGPLEVKLRCTRPLVPYLYIKD